jgi:hypothetical protein
MSIVLEILNQGGSVPRALLAVKTKSVALFVMLSLIKTPFFVSDKLKFNFVADEPGSRPFIKLLQGRKGKSDVLFNKNVELHLSFVHLT